MSSVSTKPYLLRALYDWCVDQGLTPYIAVVVDERTGVPKQYVKDGQIILNVGREAVHQLVMGNELITCSARFGGVAQELSIPVDCVAAIYARENGHGMAFEVNQDKTSNKSGIDNELMPVHSEDEPLAPGAARSSPRPHLRVIK